MRRLLVGLLLLGSIALSANSVVAAPRLLEVTLSCDLPDGGDVAVTFSDYPANKRYVQFLVQGFRASNACLPGTLRVDVQPLP